jgi:TonB family protein
MMPDKIIKVKGIFGTVLFHIGMMAVLLLLALRTPLPLPEEEGVMVNLGNDENGMDIYQMEQPAPSVSTRMPDASTNEPSDAEYMVQDIEEAPAISKKNAEARQKEPEEILPESVNETVKTDPEPEPEPQPVVNPRALYKGRSASSLQGGQEGLTGQPGDQGKPGGTPGAPGYEGNGGSGNGISFSLGGRGSLMLHKPSYDSKEQGKVVVTIKVDRKGNVTSAIAGAKGTNVSDQALWQLAKNAALRSKFVADQNAPDVQVGTITYNFIRQN